MANTEYWDKRNHTIFNSVGHWQGGIDVTIEGHSLMNDLIGKVTYMQLHILNATGQLVEKKIADWIEINFMGLSYPDSRIWCNQIAAYAGDTGTSSVAAAMAAVLSSDSRAYGGSQTTKSCMEFLKKAYAQYSEEQDFEAILSAKKHENGKPIIVGFARPIDRNDERLKPYQDCQQKLAINNGKYLNFSMLLSNYLFENYGLSINSGGYSAAFLLDQGFTPDDGYRIKTASVISGAIACYRNQINQPANSFLPMKCSDIEYTGVKPRSC